VRGNPCPTGPGAQRQELAGLTDEAERRAAMAELARLEMLQAIAEESRRKFLR
jgi:hypothetical protein